MKTVTVHEAKSQLSTLIASVEAGEDVVIRRDTVDAVRLVPAGEPVPKRVFGALAGKVTLTPAFFDPLPDDELAGWER
jgi:antitoxin (DNA-binding transcriptional repressor) of toxin-antitoxin stability system